MSGSTPWMHPEARRMLEAIAAGGEPPLETLPVAEARRVADARVIRTNFAPDPVASVWDEMIDGPAGKLRLRLYRPRADAALPVLLYLHGGRLDRRQSRHPRPALPAARVARGLPGGVGGLSPRAGALEFPAAVEDSIAAAAWVAQHIAGHGGDPGRVVAAGDSLGRHAGGGGGAQHAPSGLLHRVAGADLSGHRPACEQRDL